MIHYSFATLLDSIKAKEGGTFYISRNANGVIGIGDAGFDSGYYVALEDAERVVVGSAFDKDAIADYLAAHFAQIREQDNYFGVWVAPSGFVYLDISKHVENLEAAIQTGIGNHQIAIWDIANETTINLDAIIWQGDKVLAV